MPGPKKRGMQTVVFDNPPILASWASLAGPKKGKGPGEMILTLLCRIICWGRRPGKEQKTKC